jgi:L-amino acid N-acyltransferase YncA
MAPHVKARPFRVRADAIEGWKAMSQLRVRCAREDDAEAIAAIYRPFVLESVVSFETKAPDAAEMQARIADTGRIYPWLVADDRGRVAGYAYASRHSERAAYQWSVNVAIYLHAAYRRQGLGTRLYRILFEVLKLQGFHSLFAGIALPNDASVALHKTMGMDEVGVYRNVGFKFGAWRDVAWFGMSFDNDRPPGGPPLRFEALVDKDIEAVLDRWP